MSAAAHAPEGGTPEEGLPRASRERTLDVARVLEGKRLVVLGGTGFLGKLFWSMLLDRYPGVGAIILVVRSKGGQTPQERFWQDIATSEALEPLRRAHGDGFERFLRGKVRPVRGEMGQPLCGLDEALVRELRGTVDAVINVAGVVDFNPPLDEALEANALGARHLVDLARALGRREVATGSGRAGDAASGPAILHTSTCYVAGSRKGPILEDHPCLLPFPRAEEIDAALWDADREIAEGLELVAQIRRRSDDAFRQSELAERARSHLAARGEPAHGAPFDREVARLTRKLAVEQLVSAGLERATHWGWPNIYTYTKALGEQVVARSGLRFAIARPAICESTMAFPAPAYNEGINTSAPFAYLIMNGQQQIIGKHVPLDFIPADYVIAGMILAMAELLEGTAAPVYQLGAGDVNPCTQQRFGELMGIYKRKHYLRKGGNPLVNALQARFEPTFVSPATFETFGPPAVAKVSRGAAALLRRALPPLAGVAHALDDVARREEKVADIQRLFAPFTTRVNGPFDCANVRAARARLSAADNAKLPWSPETIDWADWMMNIHMPAMEKRVLPAIDRKRRKPVAALAAHTTLVSLVDEMAERHDLAPALQQLTREGLTRASFRDLRVRADAVAARLAAAGVVAGDRVALSARSGPRWPMAYFGIVRAGAVAVPLDPMLDAAAWGHVLADCRARAVVWDDTVNARAEVRVAHPGLACLDLHEATLEDPALTPPHVNVSPGDIASLLYTSGTTGRPKGVLLTHANFTSLVAALAPLFPLSRGDAVVSVLPLHHTFELTCGLLLPLSRGGRVVYLDELTGARMAEGLRASRATAMVGVPALWQMLERRILQQVDARGKLARSVFDVAVDTNRWLLTHAGIDVGRILFGSMHAELGGGIKWLISGGATLPAETRERFAGLGLALAEGYGLTEAAPVLTVTRPGRRLERGVGKPVPGVEIRIAHPDDRGVGEVVARGPNVMVGYTDEEATRETLDADGWLHTGDLGRLDKAGRLEIVGRLKDVVIAPTGENVYPEDVERRLGAVPHVAELAVAGIEVRGGERLACLAVPQARESHSATEGREAARAALRRAVAALAPRERPTIVHLYDAPLPRTATRKIKRDEVRAILARLVAASTSLEAGAGSSEGGARQAVAAVRGVAAGEVGAHASLQGDLGFDSLMMAELLEVLEARYGAIDPGRLQACLTVADVEGLVRGREAAEPQSGGRAPEHPAQALLLPTPVQDLGKAVVGRAQDLFYGGVMKPRVFGRAHIPHNRNVIVVANHASHLDMGLVRHALGKYGEEIVSLAAQDYFFEGGIKRAFFENLTNLKAIDRKASLRQAIRQASEVLEQGNTVLVFPEGTRSPSGAVQAFKPLIGHLALALGKDILPVFLGGTHASMPKGAPIPIKRALLARIGPPLEVRDLRRLTAGLPSGDAAREVTRLAREAVLALGEGSVIDLSKVEGREPSAAPREHPLVRVFSELEAKFRAGELEKAVSYYVSLGNDELGKWTVRVDARACEVRPGKPESGQADCVLKTSPEMFTKIVREAYVPSPADFLSGAFKSNDVALLMTFQKVFRLDEVS